MIPMANRRSCNMPCSNADQAMPFAAFALRDSIIAHLHIYQNIAHTASSSDSVRPIDSQDISKIISQCR